MSRSYKKFPNANNSDKDYKRIANKKVRKLKGISNGGCYRRSNTLMYNIRDHNSTAFSREEVIEKWTRYGDRIYQAWIK